MDNRNMARKFFKYVMMFMVVAVSTMGVCACSDEDDEETIALSEKIQGRWKMVMYENEDCDWGEYIIIQGNSMKWNSRQAGQDTDYEMIWQSDSSFFAKCIYASNNNPNDWGFTVTMCTFDSLKTLDRGKHLRVFARETIYTNQQ